MPEALPMIGLFVKGFYGFVESRKHGSWAYLTGVFVRVTKRLMEGGLNPDD